MLQSAAGKDLLVEMLAPLVSGPAQQPRLKATDDGQYTWIIENYHKLRQPKLYSPVFHSGKYNWRILIFPNGNNVTQFSLYLDVADAATLPQGWSRQAHFKVTVHNQKDPSLNVIKGALTPTVADTVVLVAHAGARVVGCSNSGNAPAH